MPPGFFGLTRGAGETPCPVATHRGCRRALLTACLMPQTAERPLPATPAEALPPLPPPPRVAELIGPEFDGTYKWGGAAVDASGIVWGIPSDAAWVLRVEPSSGAVRTLGQLSRWRNKWQGGVAAPDGNIYCVPCDAPQVRLGVYGV